MKKLGILFVLSVLFLSACGQSEPPQTKKKAKSGDDLDNYQMIVDSCPEPNYDGDTFDELSEEEQNLYDVEQISDEMKEHHPEMLQVSTLQSKRQEFLNKGISEKGYTLEDLKNIGDMYLVKGTIILQFKEQLNEEEQQVKKAFIKTADELKQKFNENAIHIEEVKLSANELRKQNDALSKIIDGSSIEDKLWGFGTCTSSNQLKIDVTEPLTNEELQHLNENAEVKIAVQVEEPNQLKGYVTEVKEDEMLVDMIWFSNRPEEVKVGDRVNVSYTNVMESLPAQSGAMETEILKDLQPEGADMKTSEVIENAVDQGKEKIESTSPHPQYLSVKEIDYIKKSDQWNVSFETTTGDEAVDIQVEDD
ncbi:DUF3221 domain-containing protein [Halobacillus litoralis]|uniref:DUF3221 domain-containing protein n=1 Tax=Halobacillus litoralis TaxID=45668 RepID=UPI002490EE16|nr:DUF3221 domain-containing protein [Halobacillus litoralis]